MWSPDGTRLVHTSDRKEGVRDLYIQASDGGGAEETFPRRLDAPVDEIPATERDENKLTAERLYRVGIPNNTLEL